MERYFLKSIKTALVLVYLVIVAGALVRMTGSGMGCPDWPKCFGYYIPPTERVELLWSPNKTFEKGQVIIVDEKLLVAKDNFVASSTFNSDNFEAFTKHDYAEFNATKTWIEYINRLVGALAGLICLISAILSFWVWKKNKKVTILSWLVVFMMGFQGWLGAKVVYSVLNPVKITIHMVMALLIVAVILYIINLFRTKSKETKYSLVFKNVVFVSLIFTLIQVILGTQVRQFVDEQIKSGILDENLWLSNPEISFYIHRSFSIIVVLINIFLLYLNKINNLHYNKISWIVGIIILEIISGILMYYFAFPIGSQAIHLVLASILFGVQFYIWLEANEKNKVKVA